MRAEGDRALGVLAVDIAHDQAAVGGGNEGPVGPATRRLHLLVGVDGIG